MLINNNYNQQSFGCIKIEKGGIDMLEKEGMHTISKIQQAAYDFSNFKWHLNIRQDSYTLTSPTTKKTYSGPFTVKRHIKKNLNKPDEYRLIIRMNDNNKENYAINFDSMAEVQSAYKSVKTSKGLDKMIKLLEILERGVKLKAIKTKLAKLKDITMPKTE